MHLLHPSLLSPERSRVAEVTFGPSIVPKPMLLLPNKYYNLKMISVFINMFALFHICINQWITKYLLYFFNKTENKLKQNQNHIEKTKNKHQNKKKTKTSKQQKTKRIETKKNNIQKSTNTTNKTKQKNKNKKTKLQVLVRYIRGRI